MSQNSDLSMEKYLTDDSDENFLLNEDGIRGKCLSHGEIKWTKKPRSSNWDHSDNIAFFNEASEHVLSVPIEDHSDNLEDSPLLINVSIT